MSLKWIDVQDLAILLDEAYPDIDPRLVRFTEMHQWICQLPGFSDDPSRSGEKILEAIQMAWIAERE